MPSNTAASVAITNGTPHAYNWYSLSLHASWPLSKLAGLKSLEKFRVLRFVFYARSRIGKTKRRRLCTSRFRGDKIKPFPFYDENTGSVVFFYYFHDQKIERRQTGEF